MATPRGGTDRRAGAGRVPGAGVGRMKDFSLVPESCARSPRLGGVFSQIYAHGSWGQSLPAVEHYYAGSRKSASGSGSDLGAATAPSARLLKRAISAHGCRSVMDVPCGDANWQFASWEMDSLPVYVGLDVVPELVALVKRRFAHHTNKAFATWDVTRCALPKIRRDGRSVPADLVQVRDLLQHLSLANAKAAVRSVFAHGPRFLLATTYQRNATNRRWPSHGPDRNPNLTWRPSALDGDGRWTPYDVDAPPFDFPEPLECLSAHGLKESQHDYDLVCLYRLNASYAAAWLRTHSRSKNE